MKLFKLLFLPFLIFCFTGCIDEDKEKEQPGANIGVGDDLPKFVIDMNDGSKLDSSTDLSGKVSVILLFSITCPQCHDQLKYTDEIYEKYKTNPNFVIFGISREQGETDVNKYWIDERLEMPYSAQNDRYIYSLFAKSYVPRIYISDANRVVRAVTVEKPATAKELDEIIIPLLEEITQSEAKNL